MELERCDVLVFIYVSFTRDEILLFLVIILLCLLIYLI
jgi:hypothetical protein